MFVSDINDVKIYNLSAGKSLPDWLTDRKKKASVNKNVDLRKRIELIQDFDMPGVSTSIRMSPDNQYILVTGTYKPRVKFETFEVLSDDYSKLVFLQTDRFVEFHAGHGRHYRLRVPKVGRALSYHSPSCDLFVVGSSSEIYRLNLERGQFMQPFESEASSFNACDINPEHHLLITGSQEGFVEAWDPREKKRYSTLDVAMRIKNYRDFPSITSLKFKNALHMAVGTASGHILLYDIRSNEPLLIKDSLNRIPIKKIDFNPAHNVVYSLDNAMLKIWDENNGKQMAYIESQSNFNDFCTIPNTGMFFFAQEDVKMQTFYIPALGPAPKWCSFLDNLTEEIESETVQNIYDDYKFVTKQELITLGLDHLEGTNLLKGYMHGYFIDMRLYNKAKSAAQPFTFENYRKEKINKKIEESRPKRLEVKSDLPKVNRELAMKFMENEESNKKVKAPNLLKDDRFKIMFENPEYEVDKNYRRISERCKSDDEDDGSKWKEVKKEHKRIQKEKRYNRQNDERRRRETSPIKSSGIKMQDLESFKINELSRKVAKASLGARVAKETDMPQVKTISGLGNRQMSFSTEKKVSKTVIKRQEEMKKHREERKQVIRPTTFLKKRK
ncbi:hypothetical protein PVAND_006422 [Polypedilum vanderplanki]|uniref:Nucleolar protein 10 n=1 Tax=Polypedilum vanderplanki TaxID=319348 RepID=A0A9J6C3K5_POLVA|nr:hypothetical protein PVAND_006422 [Polypedilum vanderplanki]